MTSKTSYFDAAIFKRSLRKTMPLWICYLVFWLFILPGDLISFVYQPEYYDSLSGRLCERILNFCTVGSILSALIGLLAAWLLFSWLFRANASPAYPYGARRCSSVTLQSASSWSCWAIF